MRSTEHASGNPMTVRREHLPDGRVRFTVTHPDGAECVGVGYTDHPRPRAERTWDYVRVQTRCGAEPASSWRIQRGWERWPDVRLSAALTSRDTLWRPPVEAEALPPRVDPASVAECWNAPRGYCAAVRWQAEGRPTMAGRVDLVWAADDQDVPLSGGEWFAWYADENAPAARVAISRPAAHTWWSGAGVIAAAVQWPLVGAARLPAR
jgi:hypothetical protein